MIAPTRQRRVRSETLPPPLDEWDVVERRIPCATEDEMDRHPAIIALADLARNALNRQQTHA